MTSHADGRCIAARLLPLFAIALGALLTAGCSSGFKLVNAWQNPDYQGPRFKNVLVAGITDKETTRRVFEDVFSQRLSDRGVAAVASYSMRTGADSSREEIEALVTQAGFDAIITARVIGVDRQTQYSGGYSTAYPSMAYHQDFYGFYNYSWGVYSTPSYAYSYDVVRIEVNVYETQEWDLVWTAQTERVDPGEVDKEAVGLADVIFKEMDTRGLF